jgi:isopenicillin-N N-acyltransferase like protein
MVKRLLKILLWLIVTIIGLILMIAILLFAGVHPRFPEPPVNEKSIYADLKPQEVDSGLFKLGNNWIRQNRYGLWEMYVEGDAFNRGVAAGKLSEELVKYQEEVFKSQIDKVVPSKNYQRFLLTVISWFNKDLTKQIKPEYLKEIYGVSLSASDKFEEYGPAYLRLLNYHAAHDIGHAMQSYYLVGCSSFATWNEKSTDSTLIVGRNFDFYFGDDFAKNKIIEFVAPDSGHRFAFVTWGGMIGVVSGMNDKGLTVTINAGTTEISAQAGTPVSIIARDILQYASNIDEAIEIASSYRVFVSESFLVSSAVDNKAVIIEKKPDSQAVTWPDSSAIICTNHFQSNEFAYDPSNLENRKNNATGYRFQRLKELMNNSGKMDPVKAATILRNKKGLHNNDIGLGNEKALNQMLAHHSVIFEPAKKIMWVSTPPNVMGPYVAYNLDSIFFGNRNMKTDHEIDIPSQEIPADAFLLTMEYKKYLNFKTVTSILGSHGPVCDSMIDNYLTLNPQYFETYLTLGNYYFEKEEYDKAEIYYTEGLRKETNNKAAIQTMINRLEKINKLQ